MTRRGTLSSRLGASFGRLASTRARGRDRRAQRHLGYVLDALGEPSPRGRPYAIVSIHGRPRWVLPARTGAPGPVGAGLYRPFRARHWAPAIALEGLQRVGALRARKTISLAGERRLAQIIAERLGVGDLELAATVTGDDRRGRRAVLAARDSGRTIAFAKIALEEGARLLHERDVLDALSRLELEILVPPRVLDCFEWDGSTVLLLEPLCVSGRTDRPLGESECAALAELRSLGEQLAPTLASDGTAAPVHGDFAPWNAARLSRGRLAVWDWEETRTGSVLEDVFHWRIQRHLRGAGESLEAIASDAVRGDGVTGAVAARLGIDPAGAPQALRQYLDRTLGQPPRASDPRIVAVRERMLALLARAAP
jgi:hypothetical protein